MRGKPRRTRGRERPGPGPAGARPGAGLSRSIEADFVIAGVPRVGTLELAAGASSHSRIVR